MYINLQETGDIGVIIVGSFVVVVGAGAANKHHQYTYTIKIRVS